MRLWVELDKVIGVSTGYIDEIYLWELGLHLSEAPLRVGAIELYHLVMGNLGVFIL